MTYTKTAMSLHWLMAILLFGLLALGSEDVQRFYPEMGTLYLGHIGDLASAALLRTLE